MALNYFFCCSCQTSKWRKVLWHNLTIYFSKPQSCLSFRKKSIQIHSFKARRSKLCLWAIKIKNGYENQHLQHCFPKCFEVQFFWKSIDLKITDQILDICRLSINFRLTVLISLVLSKRNESNGKKCYFECISFHVTDAKNVTVVEILVAWKMKGILDLIQLFFRRSLLHF